MTRSTPRQLVIWLLAPALLVGVAGVHSYLAEAKNQTPWEGGGFGMFSTVDKRQARFVRCYLVTPRREVPVRLPEHLNTYVLQLRARPTASNVESLAEYLAEATWIEVSTDSTREGSVEEAQTPPPPVHYRYLPPYESSDRPRATVEAVRVEVWRYRFVSRPFSLDAHRLVSATTQASAMPSSGE